MRIKLIAFTFFLALGLLAAVPQKEAHAVLGLDLNTGGNLASCANCGAVSGVTFGWGFTVTSAVTVDALGLFDNGSNGIGTSSQTGLWTSAGALLASATITDASNPVASASANGRWLFEGIAPIVLTPGDYLIGSVIFNTVPEFRQNAPFVTIPEITGIVGRTNGSGGADVGFGAPLNSIFTPVFGPTFNAQAVAAPEPATLLLLGSGLAAVGLFGRKRVRN